MTRIATALAVITMVPLLGAGTVASAAPPDPNPPIYRATWTHMIQVADSTRARFERRAAEAYAARSRPPPEPTLTAAQASRVAVLEAQIAQIRAAEAVHQARLGVRTGDQAATGLIIDWNSDPSRPNSTLAGKQGGGLSASADARIRSAGWELLKLSRKREALEAEVEKIWAEAGAAGKP